MQEFAGNGTGEYRPGSIVIRTISAERQMIGMLQQAERHNGRLQVIIIAATHADDQSRIGQIDHWSRGDARFVADAEKGFEAYTRLIAELGRKIAMLRTQHRRDPAHVRHEARV